MFKAMPAALSILFLFASPGQAQMSASEFEDYTTGKTLYFVTDGREYGVEEYFEGRRVRWSFLDGDCRDGLWYEDDRGLICFVYEGAPDPQCWRFRRGSGGGLVARFEDDPEGTLLYEANQDQKPMLCFGPEVGV